MKTLLLTALIALTFSCSLRYNSKISKHNSVQTDFAETARQITDVLDENVHYIGFVNNFYFSNENESFIELYFMKDEITTEEYEILENLTDSLIYSDDDNSRLRFPSKSATKHFDLRGLSKLTIFDDKNTIVGIADFVRVEYLNQNISPCFIAVYKTDRKIKPENVYVISNFKQSLEPENYTIIKDNNLTKKILTKLHVSEPKYRQENNGTHIVFKKSNTTISIVNSDNFAYIVSSRGEELNILYKSVQQENVFDLKVIPLKIHSMPCILMKISSPETDVLYDRLLFYDGTKYVIANRQRIK